MTYLRATAVLHSPANVYNIIILIIIILYSSRLHNSACGTFVGHLATKFQLMPLMAVFAVILYARSANWSALPKN